MKKLGHSQGYGIRLCLDLVLLSFSYFVSQTIVNLWYPINFSRFFLSGFLIVIFTKLAIILITLFYYMRKDKFAGVLIIVALYNLVSFCTLYLMNFDRVIEISAVNFIVDIFLIGTSRLIQLNANTKEVPNRRVKPREDKITTRDVKDISPAKHSNKKLNNDEIMLLSMLKLMDQTDETKTLALQFKNLSPLIIGKGLGVGADEKLKFILPKCIVYNVSHKGMGRPIEFIKEFAEAHSFDSIIISKENFYRLEFLDILDIVKDYPYNIEILDKNYEVHSMNSIEDILDMFPLNIKPKEDLKGSYLLAYTGDWCDELVMQLIEGGAESITVFEPNTMVLERISHIKGLRFIKTFNDLKKHLVKNYDHIIYGLPMTDLVIGQKHIGEVLSKNVSMTEEILNLVDTGGANSFTFVSSTARQNKVSAISKSYKKAELLVKSFDRDSKIKFQSIRMPNYISEDNDFLMQLEDNPADKVIEVNPKDVLTYLYSKQEAVLLLLHLMDYGQSSIAYIGEQVYLPEVYNNLNFKGIREDEIKVTFKKDSYPLNFYLEEYDELSGHQRTSCVYGYYMSEESFEEAEEGM